MNINTDHNSSSAWHPTLASLWENSRGFKGGASKAEIFLHAAAQAGYPNNESAAFVAKLNPPKLNPPKIEPVAPYDTIGGIMAYENGGLDHEGTIELFQALVDSGLAWQLQGSYGRAAQSLINAELVHAH